MNLVNARHLKQAQVDCFYDALYKSNSKQLPVDTDGVWCDRDGIGVEIDGRLNALYTYSTHNSLTSDTALCYPHGGSLISDSYEAVQSFLLNGLITQLKDLRAEKKIKIIFILGQQIMLPNDIALVYESIFYEHGFSKYNRLTHYRGSVNPALGYQLNSAFEVREYRGGDEGIDSEICSLYRKSYDGHLGVPDITPNTISSHLAAPSCSYLILYHKNELMGQATVYLDGKECYVDSFHIKRKYWGRIGASDFLLNWIFSFAQEKGCEVLSGTAASNNRASCALMERFGMTPQYELQSLALEV